MKSFVRSAPGHPRGVNDWIGGKPVTRKQGHERDIGLKILKGRISANGAGSANFDKVRKRCLLYAKP
ncbi:hypothetical protein [Luteibacter sp. E-22]|uniref:hypothetical protein n=1 Tax=Luteibacter sp. E-22 TaxID=3404050 RepID=UPI003CEEFF6A